jgi:hypothetical protein
VDPRTAGEPGAVYSPVPRAAQQRALAFLAQNAIRTPAWMAPASITRRTGGTPLATAQASVVTALLDARRLDRLALGMEMDPAAAYAPAQYLADLRRAVWSEPAPDANLRGLHRVYLDRLGALVSPPATPAGGGGEGGGEGPPSPLLAPLNVPRSDLPALARSELTAIRAQARRLAAAAPAGVQRAHWADVAARVDDILDPAGRTATAR